MYLLKTKGDLVEPGLTALHSVAQSVRPRLKRYEKAKMIPWVLTPLLSLQRLSSLANVVLVYRGLGHQRHYYLLWLKT